MLECKRADTAVFYRCVIIRGIGITGTAKIKASSPKLNPAEMIINIKADNEK